MQSLVTEQNNVCKSSRQRSFPRQGGGTNHAKTIDSSQQKGLPNKMYCVAKKQLRLVTLPCNPSCPSGFVPIVIGGGADEIGDCRRCNHIAAMQSVASRGEKKDLIAMLRSIVTWRDNQGTSHLMDKTGFRGHSAGRKNRLPMLDAVVSWPAGI